VAAGLAQRLAGNDQAGTVDQTFVDGPHEAVVGAAGVAHGREPAHQQRCQDSRRARGGERRRRHRVGRDGDQRGHHMHVAVDESGHQRLTGEINPRRALSRDRPVGNLLDAVILDEDLETLHEVVAIRTMSKPPVNK